MSVHSPVVRRAVSFYACKRMSVQEHNFERYDQHVCVCSGVETVCVCTMNVCICMMFQNNHSVCNSIWRAQIDELLTFRPFTFMYSCSLTPNRSLDSLSLSLSFSPSLIYSLLPGVILIFVFVCEPCLYTFFCMFFA